MHSLAILALLFLAADFLGEGEARVRGKGEKTYSSSQMYLIVIDDHVQMGSLQANWAPYSRKTGPRGRGPIVDDDDDAILGAS